MDVYTDGVLHTYCVFMSEGWATPRHLKREQQREEAKSERDGWMDGWMEGGREELTDRRMDG